MSDPFLLAAGVVIFSLTTVSTLWFGYSRFFEWYAQSPDDSATSAATISHNGIAPAPVDVATTPAGEAAV